MIFVEATLAQDSRRCFVNQSASQTHYYPHRQLFLTSLACCLSVAPSGCHSEQEKNRIDGLSFIIKRNTGTGVNSFLEMNVRLNLTYYCNTLRYFPKGSLRNSYLFPSLCLPCISILSITTCGSVRKAEVIGACPAVMLMMMILFFSITQRNRGKKLFYLDGRALYRNFRTGSRMQSSEEQTTQLTREAGKQSG